MVQNECFGTYQAGEVEALVKELDRQKKSRRDYVYPASKLSMNEDGTLVFAGSDTFKVGDRVFTEWADAEKAANESGVQLEYLGKSGALPLSETAEGQLCEKLGIPVGYVHRLREGENRDLAATNFRTLLERNDGRFLVRTLDNHVRAVLSTSYKVMDNGDLFFAAAQEIGENKAELWKARLSQDGFEMLAAAPHIRGQIRTDRPFDPGDGWMSRWKGGDGDVQNAACRISNSETGRGGLHIRPAILTRICCNFMIWGTGVSHIHLGKRREEEGLLNHMADQDGGMAWSDDTRQAESRTIWLKVRDVVRTTFDPVRFAAYIDRLNGATQVEVRRPEKAVENIVAEFELSEERKVQILAHLMNSGDRSRYGLAQAVTDTTHDAEREENTDAASALEEAGGELIEMSDRRFEVLAAV